MPKSVNKNSDESKTKRWKWNKNDNQIKWVTQQALPITPWGLLTSLCEKRKFKDRLELRYARRVSRSGVHVLPALTANERSMQSSQGELFKSYVTMSLKGSG